MIRSAALKLTLYYLTIIMALSLGFSLILYRISTNELNRGLRRPPPGFVLRAGNGTVYEEFRRGRLAESGSRLRDNLLLFNLLTLLAGGALSYALARRTLRPIEDSYSALERFTADASHELRTPLTAMKTEIEVGLRSSQLSKSDYRRLLESNLEEVGKLVSLANGLLMLAQPDNQGLNFEAVPLGQAVNTAIKRLEKAAAARGISLDNRASDLKVRADREALTELVAILLDNAVKYSDPDSSVTVSSNRHGHLGVVEVRDQGRGISAEDLPHIFERFYRADASRSKTSPGGYGLGLSIAQQIAKRHGGSIEAHSQPGHGAVFSVKLPLAA